MFVAQLDFGQGATFSVDSYTSDGELFKRDSVKMDKAAYDQWLNDDTYAIQYVLAAMGYQADPSRQVTDRYE
jgi:hypothetical protein